MKATRPRAAFGVLRAYATGTTSNAMYQGQMAQAFALFDDDITFNVVGPTEGRADSGTTYPVPEPTSLLLLSAVAIPAIRRRKRAWGPFGPAGACWSGG